MTNRHPEGDHQVASSLTALVDEDDLRTVCKRRQEGLEHGVVRAGPPCKQTMIGRSRIVGPSGTSPSPSTSK
jgi:hypothetical protein